MACNTVLATNMLLILPLYNIYTSKMTWMWPPVVCCTQELEIQASHHGINATLSPGLNTEASFIQNQLLQPNPSMQAGAGDGQPPSHLNMDGAMAQTSPSPFLAVPPSGSPAAVAVNGPLHLETFSFTELDEHAASDLYPDVGLSDILMDDVRGSDVLFSPMSPGASKTSSQGSSINMEDDLWPNIPLDVCFSAFSLCGTLWVFF